jgi:hydrogenase-4 component F
MAGVLWIPLLVPLGTAAASALPRAAAVRRVAGPVAATAVLATGVTLLVLTRAGGTPSAAGGLLRSDALSAYVLTVVGAVGLTATWGGLRRRGDPGAHPRAYACLVALFLGAMALAVLADNLGVLWVAVEGTTVTTAFLVGHHRTRRSLEAAWKYVVLGSVGVAIAFLGVVLMYAATDVAGAPTLSWTVLAAGGPQVDPALMKVGAALAVLGFATKAGLAPMHSWLPDAHSQAPAPVSGLMSGVLLSVAFYAIMRVQTVSDAVLGPQLMRALLGVAGLLSLAVAAALVLRQQDYKRLLAYSSIEHMGLLALGAAIGTPAAIAATLLHMLGHGLTKASLFVVAGRVLEAEGSSRIGDVRGLLARRPDLGVPLVVGMAALLGLPPSVLFLSEVGIFLAGWQAGAAVVVVPALVLVFVVFAGIARQTARLAFGDAGDGMDAAPPAEAAPRHRPAGPRLPLALALGVSVLAGVAVPLGGVLTRAATVLAGAP